MFQKNLFRLLLLFSLTLFAQNTDNSKKIQTFNLHSNELNCDRKIWVYTPVNYSSVRKKYPVIYMHDAQNLFDDKTSFAGEWKIDETLDSLKAEVIVVGIEHGNDKRIDELTPYKNEKYGGGKADSYLNFLINTVKPYVEKKYRIKKGAKNTSIAGSSLGGLVSYYAALKYPKIFDKAIIFSPSFWFSNDIYTLTKNTSIIKTKMYFLCGDSESDEMVIDLNKMTDLLKGKIKNYNQINITVVENGQHNEKLWREAFAKAYLWLLK